MEKVLLRTKYKQIKQSLLTTRNNNWYHSRLLTNFQILLQEGLPSMKAKDSVMIGSYIHKPVSQIVPPLLNHIQANGKIQLRFAYPFFTKLNRNLQFFQHKHHFSYETGDYGIKICAPAHRQAEVSQKLTAVLVPLVAFNENKHRIGEGGGFYDMFIRKMRQANLGSKDEQLKKLYFIGVGLEELKMRESSLTGVFEEWDQPLDYIITETAIYQ